MRELYKTVYELKKELDEVKKELRDVKGCYLNHMFLYLKPYELNVNKYRNLINDGHSTASMNPELCL